MESLPPPGSGLHSCGLSSPPQTGQHLGCHTSLAGTPVTPVRCPRRTAVGCVSQSSALFLLRGTHSWLWETPLPCSLPPGASGSAWALTTVSCLAGWLEQVCTQLLAALPQRLRGPGVSWGRGSRWGPWAEPTRAGSSPTGLVLLPLPPRAAQGPMSCWGRAWSPVELPSTL